jgi:SAM-dependent methyltransferase
VLEIGSGTGNLTRELIPRELYYASDINPLYLDSLKGLTFDRPYLHVSLTDVTKSDTFPRIPGGFDTVICLNVVERVDDDRGALENIRRVLAANGRAIVLVPHGPQIHGTLDQVSGHRRRYTPESFQQLADQAGFSVQQTILFNRAGWPVWWLNGKVLKRRSFGFVQILALNALTPVFRRIDQQLPFPPLSLIAILQPRRNG